jgi:hypothetical protein
MNLELPLYLSIRGVLNRCESGTNRLCDAYDMGYHTREEKGRNQHKNRSGRFSQSV